jgi:hypothetical protein
VHPRKPANGVCSSRRLVLDDMHSVHNGIGVAPSGVVSKEARGTKKKNAGAEVGGCFAVAGGAASSLGPTRSWVLAFVALSWKSGIKGHSSAASPLTRSREFEGFCYSLVRSRRDQRSA